MKLNYEVHCNDCGAKLEIMKCILKNEEDIVIFFPEACQNCCEDAQETGIAMGVEKGKEEGYEEAKMELEG